MYPSQRDSWKIFDQISSTYDSINRILSFGMDRSWRRALLRHIPSQAHVLDLATGTGDQLFALFPHIRSAFGIDLSEAMLALAKKKGAHLPIEWIKADAQALPFPDHTFDAATFSFGIRNVLDPLAALQEIRRVLKPKGVSLILEFSLPPRPIRPFYLLYLRHLLPRIGSALSSHKQAYRYLNQTIETFPYGKAFCQLLERASFHSISMRRMALGAVTLYRGQT